MNFESMTKTMPGWALGEVRVREAQPEEMEAACAALQREHYLGAPGPHQRDLVQLAVRAEQVVAVLVWTRAARKLAGREAWVGWDPRTRTRRLPLVVQNNRFLVLSAERQPNLASRVLGLGGGGLAGALEEEDGNDAAIGGDLRGSGAICRDVLQGGRLDRGRADGRLWPSRRRLLREA